MGALYWLFNRDVLETAVFKLSRPKGTRQATREKMQTRVGDQVRAMA